MKGYYRKKGKGWQYTIEIGTDPVTGKRKQKSKGGFKTKKEAEMAAREVMLSVDQGANLLQGKIHFKAFFEKWFYTQYKKQVEPSTFATREYNLKNHILPHFGEMKMQDITVYDIDAFYDQKLDEELATGTIRIMHNLLSRCFKQARKWGTLRVNPVLDATPPPVKKKDIAVWSQEEGERFLKVAMEDEKHLPFFIAFYTGMRKGEVLGLRWSDIDFENKVIKVSKSLARLKNGLVLKSPKTQCSKRNIVVSDKFLNVLMVAKKHQQCVKESLGDSYHDQDFVVSTLNGNPMDPRNIIRQMKSIATEANVPYITFHGLRHTHATLLLKAGVHPKIVAERLGHSQIKITLDTYTHSIQSLQEDAARLLDTSIDVIAA